MPVQVALLSLCPNAFAMFVLGTPCTLTFRRILKLPTRCFPEQSLAYYHKAPTED